jgi:hypothetical protein
LIRPGQIADKLGREVAKWSPINLDMPALELPKNTMPSFLRRTLLVQFERTARALSGEQMGKKILREGKTQRLVVAAIEQGGLRYKVKEMARKISTFAISSWHFPK